MPLDEAYNKALAELSLITPHVTAAKSGCKFEGGMFHIPFFDRNFFVSFPIINVEEPGQATPPPKIIQLVVFHYLLTADGTKAADDWIGYRQLPASVLFVKRFHNLAINSLIRTFGHDPDGFRQAALSLGGVPMGRTGDASFRFLALPNIPMACILHLGDEEMEPGINILFDASISHYLPVEDITFLGSYLSSTLRQRTNV